MSTVYTKPVTFTLSFPETPNPIVPSCFWHYGAVTRNDGPGARVIQLASRKNNKNATISLAADPAIDTRAAILNAPVGSLWQLKVYDAGGQEYSTSRACSSANTAVYMGANCMQLSDNAACHFYPGNKFYTPNAYTFPQDPWMAWKPASRPKM